MRRWLGIDFSGDYRMWSPGRSKTNVWIADVRSQGEQKVLNCLVPVQRVAGVATPFRNLINLLKSRDFEAAAIDAPFSLPFEYLPAGGHERLLDIVSKAERAQDRPFPEAKDFLRSVLADRPLNSKKPLRRTEQYWRDRKVNVRSTLWSGPRGGAAMTSACLTLLCSAQCPIWPWDQPPGRGLLVEAFPAAQLCHWKLCYQAYNGRQEQAHAIRRGLVGGISTRVNLGRFRQELEGSADKLDAVVCALAAIAVTTHSLPHFLNQAPSDDEGLIAILN